METTVSTEQASADAAASSADLRRRMPVLAVILASYAVPLGSRGAAWDGEHRGCLVPR